MKIHNVLLYKIFVFHLWRLRCCFTVIKATKVRVMKIDGITQQNAF